LEHVINTGTQKVISSYSKSKHYDPTKPKSHVPDEIELLHQVRDEVAIIRTISVKVMSIKSALQTFLRAVFDDPSLGVHIAKTEGYVSQNSKGCRSRFPEATTGRHACLLVNYTSHDEASM
jgi:hypothetical protein